MIVQVGREPSVDSIRNLLSPENLPSVIRPTRELATLHYCTLFIIFITFTRLIRSPFIIRVTDGLFRMAAGHLYGLARDSDLDPLFPDNRNSGDPEIFFGSWSEASSPCSGSVHRFFA